MLWPFFLYWAVWLGGRELCNIKNFFFKNGGGEAGGNGVRETKQ